MFDECLGQATASALAGSISIKAEFEIASGGGRVCRLAIINLCGRPLPTYLPTALPSSLERFRALLVSYSNHLLPRSDIICP